MYWEFKLEIYEKLSILRALNDRSKQGIKQLEEI